MSTAEQPLVNHDPTHVDLEKLDPDEKDMEQKMIKTILNMPKAVQDRFKVLHMLSERRNKLNDEFNAIIEKVNRRYYEERQKPIYDARKKLIEGETTPEVEEMKQKFEPRHQELEEKIKEIEAKPKDEDAPPEPEEKPPTDVSHLKGKQGVPDFWQKVIKNSPMLAEKMSEKDHEVLEHLKHVETETKDDEETKRTLVMLRLYFASDNDWLSNEILEVTLDYDSAEDGSLVKVKGTEIEWLEGKDPTKKKIKKKQKHKKTGETRTVTKTVDCQSLFNIFQDLKRPEKGEPELDEEEAGEFEDKMDLAQQIVEHFDEELVPDALAYYLNMAIDYGDYGDEGDDDEDGDEGSDPDEEKPKKKKGKKDAEDETAETGADKKECKQQ